jgi:L-ectoine synthase
LIEDAATRKVHDIRPGILYALDRHDQHVVRAATQLTLACVFTPPLTGRETHDESGSYPLEEEAVEG